MRCLSSDAQHIGSRRSQQDCYGFSDAKDSGFFAHGGFLAVLCDGMGGMAHGELASQTAVRAVLDAYALKTPSESIPDALERSLREANRRVLAIAREMRSADGVGTTLIAVVVHEQLMHYVSVGDSGLYVVRGGKLQLVNRAHVYANLLDQAVALGALSSEQAASHPEREALTSFVGIQKLLEIDRNADPLPLQAGDTILIASDGMFKTLRAAEIEECLTGNPQSWASVLVQRTIAKGRASQDNVTVVSVTLAEDSVPNWIPFSPSSIFATTPAGAEFEEKESSRRRRRWAWIAAVLVLILDAVLIAWIYVRR